MFYCRWVSSWWEISISLMSSFKRSFIWSCSDYYSTLMQFFCSIGGYIFFQVFWMKRKLTRFRTTRNCVLYPRKVNKNIEPWAFVSLPAVEKYRILWISALLTEGELHMYCSISCAGLAITACSDYHLERNSLKQKSSRSLQKADEPSIQS